MVEMTKARVVEVKLSELLIYLTLRMFVNVLVVNRMKGTTP